MYAKTSSGASFGRVLLRPMTNPGDTCGTGVSEESAEAAIPPLSLLDDESPQSVLPSDVSPACFFRELPSPPRVVAPRRKTLEEDVMECVPAVEKWTCQHANFVHTLQQAVRNHGRVDLMKYKLDEARPQNAGSLAVGDFVAVKRMPNGWITASPKDFMSRYPTALEQPWLDIGVLSLLNKESFDYVVNLHGVFQDSEHTFVMLSLASQGDLFSWIRKVPSPGLQREVVLQPIVAQMIDAVRWLHDFGIAHRDLCLENMLINDESGQLRVKLIDFGMATVNRMCRGEVRGKPSYQAPEMHLKAPYDCFLSDVFALGVTIFAMACEDYPWNSTKPGFCRLCEYASKHGVIKMLGVRQLRRGRRGERLQSVLSAKLTSLLVEMLRFDPCLRSTLGEACYSDRQRPSIIGQDWVLPATRAADSIFGSSSTATCALATNCTSNTSTTSSSGGGPSGDWFFSGWWSSGGCSDQVSTSVRQ